MTEFVDSAFNKMFLRIMKLVFLFAAEPRVQDGSQRRRGCERCQGLTSIGGAVCAQSQEIN